MPTPKPVPPPVQMREEFPLEIRRTFAVPRERVFAAWAEREQLERWMCKDVAKHEVTHHEQDIRPGGNWRMEIRDPKKNETYWGRGTYLEVKPPEKIVFTWSWTKEVLGTPGQELHPESPVTEVTMELFDRGGRTELVLTHRGLGSEKLRKEHEGGWTGCLNEMEKTFA
jgi:uncharacterized protein YndB with AHSA1/START domain